MNREIKNPMRKMMQSARVRIYLPAVVALMMSGCSDDNPFDAVGTKPAGDGGSVKITADISQVNVTRADDSGFADGDIIGVYAVEFGSDGMPAELKPSGNNTSNRAFTFDYGAMSWTASQSIYFPDEKTPMDFYGYYPYINDIDNVSVMPFSVMQNQAKQTSQGGMSAYEASDLLWAKSAGITPDNKIVNLKFTHILSGVMVTLVEGENFEAGEWPLLSKSVLVSGTTLNSTVNLSTGAVTPKGSEKIKVTANPDGVNFRAVVIPQSVAPQTELLAITVDGTSYSYKRQESMVYEPGKLHKFTIKVSKRGSTGDYAFELVSEAITAWESDLTSHDGASKEYVIVNIKDGQRLADAISEAGLSAEDILNLKIVGKMDIRDFEYMRKNMPYLEGLSLKEVTLLNRDRVPDYCIPNSACEGMENLTSVVFPDKLIKIGELAFRNTNISGTLNLPEGLTHIGGSAFSNWQNYTQSNLNLTGELRLPSTLKSIGGSAFENAGFSGELVLPDGLEEIGGSAFADCQFLTGEIRLPSKLKVLGDDAFSGCPGLRGTLRLSHNMVKIPRLADMAITSVIMPEKPTEIVAEAFRGTKLRGDMVIPESVTYIGESSFSNTELSHIKFPSNLQFIENSVCSGCVNLLDTITIPPLIETIGADAFAGCTKLDAVILPKSVSRIKDNAFRDCHALTYLRCEAVEPPTLPDNAFYGVERDNFTVEVPEGSVEAYRNAPGWKEFRRIAAYRNFVARPSKYNVLNKGGELEVVLNADAEWELEDMPSWCSVSKSSGNKKTTLTLKVSSMEHGASNRSGKVTFRLKGDHNYTTTIDVGQYDYEYDENQEIQLQKATVGRGIDLVICGDGYDALDISSGVYLQDMKQEIEYLFGVEPYKTYRDYFNVYTAIAMSEDSGVESLNYWRRTKFHTCVGDGMGHRLTASWEDAMDFCLTNVSEVGNNDKPVGVILVSNTDMYEGVTYMLGDSFCAIVTRSTQSYPNDARGLIQHEVGGHGIGWLADEYVYHMSYLQTCTCTCCEHEAKLRSRQAGGFGLNLSLQGTFKSIPWRHLMQHPTYHDIVDIYEGGYFHQRGVFRSEYNSCMNNNVAYYSTWSRQLIVERIMKLAGMPFTLESFYANDKRNEGDRFIDTRSQGLSAPSTRSHDHHGPVFIKNYKHSKKRGGRK